MSKKNIISINCEIPGGICENFKFFEKKSLIDFDIIIVSPIKTPILFGVITKYMGKSCYSDDDSYRIRESAIH